MNESVRYFPFSAGIPWRFKKGRDLIQELENEAWEGAVADKDIIILAHGGLLESFFSLSISEALAKLKPLNGQFWAGNRVFKPMAQMHGLVKFKSITNIAPKYPVPLFFDKKNRIYFNCLNHYLEKPTWYNRWPRPVRGLFPERIFRNSLLNWNRSFVPQLRNLSVPSEVFTTWCKVSKFWPNQRYIFLAPSHSFLSIHKRDCLGWDIRAVKQFAAMLARFNLKLAVLTDYQYDLNANIIRVPNDVDIILRLLANAWMVLAHDIDFYLVSMCLSDAILASNSMRREFNLQKNAEFLEQDNVIYTTDRLTPLEVYNLIEGFYG